MNLSKPYRHLICRVFLTLITICIFASGHISQAKDLNTYSAPQLLKDSGPNFASPQDLAITPDGGYLLVADTENNMIKVLQPGTLKTISQFGANFLKKPQALKFDQHGTLLVMDNDNKRVTSYLFEGVYRDGDPNVKRLEAQPVSNAAPIRPGSATDSSGQSYHVDTAGNQIEIQDKNQNRIGVYGPAGLNAPMAVETVGRYFWIADTGNNRVLLLKAPQSADP